MYSCLHCEVVSSNRNSFNRHLREHLGTDVEFLRNKISEEEKVDLEKTGEDFSHELEESDERETEFDQTSEPDLKDTSIGEETGRGDISEVTTDDIFSILQRYQHLDDDDIKPEPTVGEDIVGSNEVNLDNFQNQTAEAAKTWKETSKENIQPVENSPNVKIEISEDQTERKEEDLDDENKECLDSKDLCPTESKKKTIGIGQAKMKSKAHKSFFCPECGKSFTQKGNMKTHYKSIHEGMKYPCRQCEFLTIYPSNLRTHVKSVHGGVNRKRPIQSGN